MAVRLLESRRERRLLVTLGRGRERVEPLERLDEDLGAEDGEARRELPRGLLRADRCRGREEDRPRVHALVHLEGRETGHRLATHDRPLDRRRAAVARQE